MRETFDARLDFDERTEIRQSGDFAMTLDADGVAEFVRDAFPRIAQRLLDAQRNAFAAAVAAPVDGQDLHLHFVADLHAVFRLHVAAPAHLGDMDHAFDAAEIDERAEVHDFHDGARHDVAFAQAVLQAFAILRGLLVQQLAAAQHEIAAVFAVFRHKERKGLADVFRGLLLHAARVHLRERAEALHAGDLHAETALALRKHFAFDRNLVTEGLLDGAVDHVAAHLDGQLDAVVRPAHAERLDRVAFLVFQLALVVFKVDAVDDTVHAGADVDKDRALADHRDGALHFLARPDRGRQLVQPAFHDVVEIFSVHFTHCFSTST